MIWGLQCDAGRCSLAGDHGRVLPQTPRARGAHPGGGLNASGNERALTCPSPPPFKLRKHGSE